MILVRHEVKLQELKATERLPSPSNTSLAIMRMAQSDDATAHSVADLVQTDPALSSRILKFVNSAALSLRRPIISIKDAVQLLGMNAIAQFAVSLSVIWPIPTRPLSKLWIFKLLVVCAMPSSSLQAVSRLQPVTIPRGGIFIRVTR